MTEADAGGPTSPPQTYFDGLPKEESMLSRRDFIKTSVKLAVAGALIPGALSQLLPAVAPSALGRNGTGPIIKRDPATNSKIPVTIATSPEHRRSTSPPSGISFLPRSTK